MLDQPKEIMSILLVNFKILLLCGVLFTFMFLYMDYRYDPDVIPYIIDKIMSGAWIDIIVFSFVEMFVIVIVALKGRQDAISTEGK